MHRRVLAATTLAALALLGSAPTLAAYGDEPASSPPPAVRPPDSVLRHVDAPRTAAASPAADRREVVVLVGGYQSCACKRDPDFDRLRAMFEGAGFDVVQFGMDPRYPYDTYGHIAPNAIHLRDQVRGLSNTYGAIHLVTHSMGGVVADQAFAAGLGRGDGVVSYVALASPHSGSAGARTLATMRAITGSFDGFARDVALGVANLEIDSDAVRDLASAAPVRPPAGVVRLDIRGSRDLMVTARDAADPGVTSRVIDEGPTAHGDILRDPEVLRLTLDTVVGRRVPPDTRGRALLDAAARHSDGTQRLVDLVLPCLLLLGVGLWLARRPVAPLVDPILRGLPWPRRRTCP